MLLSVVIPAFNEERYLPLTLAGIRAAAAAVGQGVEILVVDNDSSDRTADAARSFGATVVTEKIHNIARVRNTGAAFAHGDILAFIDADTLVPAHFFRRVQEAMSSPNCLGGCADILHRPDSKFLRAYLTLWRWLALMLRMRQGAAQFCRKSAFTDLNGYDESLFMGEDVDFYWRLGRLCKKSRARLEFLADVCIEPSPRRFNRLPLWRTLLVTNPLYLLAFRRRKAAWADWYVQAPR